MQKIALIVVIIALVCALPGCARLPGGKVFDPASSQIRKAEKLLESGNYQEAANIFWSVAGTKSSPQREALQIRAA